MTRISISPPPTAESAAVVSEAMPTSTVTSGRTVEVGIASETAVDDSAAGGGEIKIQVTDAGNLEVTNG